MYKLISIILVIVNLVVQWSMCSAGLGQWTAVNTTRLQKSPFTAVYWMAKESSIIIRWSYGYAMHRLDVVTPVIRLETGQTIQSTMVAGGTSCIFERIFPNQIYQVTLKCSPKNERNLTTTILTTESNDHYTNGHRSVNFSIATGDPPPSPPDSIQLVNVSVSQFCFRWRCIDYVNKIIAYNIQLHKVTNNGIIHSPKTVFQTIYRLPLRVDNPLISYCIGALAAGTGYTLRLNVIQSDGRESDYSPSIAVWTNDMPSGPVSEARVDFDVGRDSIWGIEVEWMPPVAGNGIVRAYFVVLHPRDTNVATSTKAAQCSYMKVYKMVCADCPAYQDVTERISITCPLIANAVTIHDLDLSRVVKKGNFSHYDERIRMQLHDIKMSQLHMIYIFPVNRAGVGSFKAVYANTHDVTDKKSQQSVSILANSSQTIQLQWKSSIKRLEKDAVNLVTATEINTGISVYCILLRCSNCYANNVSKKKFPHVSKRLRECSNQKTIVFEAPKKDLTVSIIQLKPFTQYKVEVYRYTNGLLKMWASEIIATFEGKPGQPTKISFNQTIINNLTVTWSPPQVEDRRGIIRSYGVEATLARGEVTTPGHWWGPQELEVNEPGSRRIQLSGLEACCVYCVTVWAITSAGRGEASAVECHYQRAFVLPQIPSLHLVAYSNAPSSLNVRWVIQSVGRCSIVYIVALTSSENRTLLSTVTSLSDYTFNNLESDTSYRVRVRSLISHAANDPIIMSEWTEWTKPIHVISGVKRSTLVIQQSSTTTINKLAFNCTQLPGQCHVANCSWDRPMIDEDIKNDQSNLFYVLTYYLPNNETYTFQVLEKEFNSNVSLRYHLIYIPTTGTIEVKMIYTYKERESAPSYQSLKIEKMDCKNFESLKKQIMEQYISITLIIVASLLSLVLMALIWRKRTFKDFIYLPRVTYKSNREISDYDEVGSRR